jgi:hypothetical protein
LSVWIVCADKPRHRPKCSGFSRNAANKGIGAEKSEIKRLTFTKKSDILFEVMRVETQTHIRNQGVAIAEVRGALQILAQTNLVGKENIQERLKHWEAKLTDIQNKLTEIENSEDLEWLEDKAGIEA